MSYHIKTADLVVLDSSSDISGVPTTLNVGAEAVVADSSGIRFMLSPARAWEQTAAAGSAGTATSPTHMVVESSESPVHVVVEPPELPVYVGVLSAAEVTALGTDSTFTESRSEELAAAVEAGKPVMLKADGWMYLYTSEAGAVAGAAYVFFAADSAAPAFVTYYSSDYDDTPAVEDPPAEPTDPA